ncbi:MAG: N-acetylmuramoyl-L-alanine amidase [[Clostridium] scindens]
MDIIKHGLRFRGNFTYRNRTDEIIWHHAEANCTVEDIHSWHLNNGWIGCGYNLIIYKDGTVHEGRPLNAVGAHASGHNSRSVGVCCIGRYDIETMPQAQLDAARQVQAYLKGLYPGAETKRHKDVNATSCPGKNFPFSEIAGTPGDASAEASTVGRG